MAFTKITENDKKDKGVSGLPTTPNLTATAMQERFDSLANVAIDGVNTLAEELEKTTAASNIGTANGNLQDVLNQFEQSKTPSIDTSKFDKQIAEISSRLDDIDTEQETLQTGLEQANATVQETGKLVDLNKSAIEKMDARISVLEAGEGGGSSSSNVSDVTIQYMQADIKVLQSDVTNIKSELDETQNELSTFGDEIDEAQKEIESVKETISNSEALVEENKANIAVANASLLLLSSEISEIVNKTENDSNNIAVGENSLVSNTEGTGNVGIGYQTIKKNTSGSGNVAIGNEALLFNQTGSENVAIGNKASYSGTETNYVVAIGSGACKQNQANGLIGIGFQACYLNTTGAYNSGIGEGALRNNTTGSRNVAIGNEALSALKTGDSNTAIGNFALSGIGEDYSNCTGIGSSCTVTGSNQVQLGNEDTTTYCYGAVQNRSDVRDKTDVRDTDLGLEFINKLRAVKFRWNYREAYREIDKNGNVIEYENDGSRAGTRFHEGLIAQEVKQVMDELGVEFAGYQDHSVNGGKDVLTIGYGELITPLIKAVQELSAKVQELESKIS